ncbi:5604_t:CDS:2, partial [Paraglomus occultum]
ADREPGSRTVVILEEYLTLSTWRHGMQLAKTGFKVVRVQTEKVLKKYWNSFKTVVTDPSKKSQSPVQKNGRYFQKGKNLSGIELVKCENLENALKEILQSSFRKYFLISGEYGTGKTTLVQNTIFNLQEPKGVVLFECSSDVKGFAEELSNHLDSNYYMKKYKPPIVLILDQVDRIAKEDPKFLRILQDFAKDCAEKGTLVIIFIASEGLVPQIMKSRSAWSRANIPFDISDEEAVKFLQDSGGRFILLKEVQILNQVNPKNLVEKFKEQTFTQIKRDLDTVELPENHEFFIKLIEVDRIDIKNANTIIPLNMIHKLVEANILKENQDYTVSFHSPILKR